MVAWKGLVESLHTKKYHVLSHTHAHARTHTHPFTALAACVVALDGAPRKQETPRPCPQCGPAKRSSVVREGAVHDHRVARVEVDPAAIVARVRRVPLRDERGADIKRKSER